MTASVPVGQALDQAQQITALKAEVESLRIAHDRADGALADAETVPTGDLERGIRALTAERDGLKTTLEMWAIECGESGPRPIKAEVERLTAEAAWIRKKVGLPEDTPLFAGDGPTLAGKMHNLCAHAHGYLTYIVAYKCDDKQGEIARLTVRAEQAEADVKALAEALQGARKYVQDRWSTWKEPMALDRLAQIDAALARPGAVRVREEGEVRRAPKNSFPLSGLDDDETEADLGPPVGG